MVQPTGPGTEPVYRLIPVAPAGTDQVPNAVQGQFVPLCNLVIVEPAQLPIVPFPVVQPAVPAPEFPGYSLGAPFAALGPPLPLCSVLGTSTSRSSLKMVSW